MSPFCTKCGTVMHEDDVNNHVCNEIDIPKKGEPISLESKIAKVVESEVAKVEEAKKLEEESI